MHPSAKAKTSLSPAAKTVNGKAATIL